MAIELKHDTWRSGNAHIPMGNSNETETQIAKRIDTTFRMLNKFVNGVVDGYTRCVIVSGAAGCGKTYAMEEILKKRLPENDFHMHSGALSDLHLYKNLYKYRGRGQIFCPDDCDEIYDRHGSLNLLKAATDTKKNQRIISWGKESWALLASKNDGEEIPKEFEYNGSLICCTNMDLLSVSQRNTKTSRHIAAFLDRNPYLDLGIHTKREILVRIWQVMQYTNFRAEQEISTEMGNEILKWIRDNIARIQRPSIRTAVKLAGYMKTDPEEWQDMAECMMFAR